MEKIHIVLCRYEGCDEFCSGGAHIVGAFQDEYSAEDAAKDHEKNVKEHLHGFYTEVISTEIK